MKLLIFLIVYLIAETESYRGYYKKWKQRKPICEPLECAKNCKEEAVENGCPKCVCEPMCTEPVCPKGCVLKEQFDGPCPGCDCSIEEEEEELKDIIEPRILEPPAAKIDIPIEKCSPPKCPPGCTTEVDFLGPCPGCKCDKDEGPGPVRCSPPKCPPGCEIEKFFNSPCPGCKCDKVDVPGPVLCSPPKCPLGCEIEKDFDGPCPGCKCDKVDVPEPFEPPVECMPPKCFPGCKLEFKGKCPECKCEIKVPEPFEPPVECMPPKCPPGCELEFKGKCAECKCDIKVPEPEFKKTCDPVKCSPECKEELDPKGCPTCICDVKCDPPKCDLGCELEEDPKGVCPICICKEKEVLPPVKEEEEEKKCPVLEDCSKPGCEKKVDENGCDICECKPICDPPKCPRRCKIDNSGECPKCVCKKFHWGRKK